MTRSDVLQDWKSKRSGSANRASKASKLIKPVDAISVLHTMNKAFTNRPSKQKKKQ